MAEVIVRFHTPDGIAARIAAWRLAEPYGHAVLIVDETAYSSQIPWVTKYHITDPRVAIPPRDGRDLVVEVTDDEKEAIRAWCESKLGVWYDLLALLGWIFYFNGWHSLGNTYCFEFCREAFEKAGILGPTDYMVSGHSLMLDLILHRLK